MLLFLIVVFELFIYFFLFYNIGLKEMEIDLFYFLKINENIKWEFYYKVNNEFVRRIVNRWFVIGNKVRKYFEVVDGSGMVEGNRMG